MNKLALSIATAAMLTGCASQGGNNATNSTTNSTKSKSIVVYYSQNGGTEKVAKIFSERLGIEIDSIVCNEPYDSDFGKTIQRWQEERQKDILPAIKPIGHNIADYDTIYLGYPVWGGTYASPMMSFITATDLKGKVIVPFCTFGSGGLNTSTDNLKDQLKDTKVLDGYGVRAARISKAKAEIETFLINSGIAKGKKTTLPDFSEQKPVTEDEKKIFDAACSSYSMPLGSPLTVGKRDIANGVEYLFTVENKTPDGNTSQSKIFVIVSDGAEPEFTQVVR